MEVGRPAVSDAMLDLLGRLRDLDGVVTGRSRSASAALEAVGSRVEKAVADVDALQLRFVRSLAGFEVLWQRIEKELAGRRPLPGADADRIADEIVACLRDHVGDASAPATPDRPAARPSA